MPITIKIAHGVLDVVSFLFLLNVFLKKNLWKTLWNKNVDLLGKILAVIVFLIMLSVMFNIITDSILLCFENSRDYVYFSSFILDRILTTFTAYFCFLIYRLSEF